MNNLNQSPLLKLIPLLFLLMVAEPACKIKIKTAEEPADMKKIDMPIGDVYKVIINGIPQVDIVRAKSASIIITASPEDLGKVEMDTINGTLTVKYKEGERQNTVRVTLRIDRLESLKANAVGNLRMEDILDTERAEVELNGIGQADLQLTSREIRCAVSSAAKVKIAGVANGGDIRLTAIALLDLSGFDAGSAKLQKTAIAKQ